MSLSSEQEHKIKLLEDNQKSTYILGIPILLKLLDNIINEPENSKYRTIRLNNKIIEDKLLPINGIKAVLLDIGFKEIDGMLTLSSTTLIGKLKKFREFIKNRLEIVNSDIPSTSYSQKNNVKSGAIKKYRRPVYIPSKNKNNLVSEDNVIISSNAFLSSLETHSDNVLSYEDTELQQFGRDCIPMEKLKTNALENLRHIQKDIKNGKYNRPEPCFKDLLLIHFTEWFNTAFFKWVNEMSCKICGAQSKCSSSSIENSTRVENYVCCNTVTKFYRYNDVAILLTTRQGRCGEYANCFSFLCRCLGYDTRHVLGNFDHVWTEVYSTFQKRWLHVDPSENVIDAPLMYEHGWHRPISYVIAYSKDDIQDVTWRYSNKHQEVLLKRKNCTERELLDTLLLIRQKRQNNCSAIRRKYLTRRTLKELVMLMATREPTDDEKKGRSSGSLVWRQSRGEQNLSTFFIFYPSKEDKELRQFNLRYSCAKDTYEKYLMDKNQQITTLENFKTWNSCIFAAQNIFRKIEKDWNMVYLARTEDTEEAKIEWKFDFLKDNLKIKNIFIRFETKIYENGKIQLKFFDEHDEAVNDVQKLKKSRKFKIQVSLSGGKGDVAWQHTQLFRQESKSNQFPFEICINFY